jgi:hypothetical protein
MSSDWLQADNRRSAPESTGWHAVAAVGLILLLLTTMGACGEEDFTVGGPLPTRPSVGATRPSATPDDDF